MVGSNLEGRRIAKVRPMTIAEKRHEYWQNEPEDGIVLVLDDGTKLFPSRDAEGNGPGALFGVGKNGVSFSIVFNKGKA